MRGTKIESLSEFGSFYRKIELSKFVRNWHILGVRILSKIELFCRVENCRKMEMELILNISWKMQSAKKPGAESPRRTNQKNLDTPTLPVTPTAPRLPMRTPRPHDTLGSVGNVHDDSWEWHGK